jgi:hypothetical protein
MAYILLTSFIVVVLFFFFLKNIKKEEHIIAALCLSGILFFGLSFGINLFIGPLKCSDGWHSQSIGNNGACSHHGGVESRSEVVIISFISSVGLFFFYIFKLTPPHGEKEQIQSESIGSIYALSILEQNVNLIQKAIKAQQKITFSYVDKNGKQTDRVVLPYELNIWNRTIYCVGRCYLAKGKRTFSLLKMKNVEVFEYPEETI